MDRGESLYGQSVRLPFHVSSVGVCVCAIRAWQSRHAAPLLTLEQDSFRQLVLSWVLRIRINGQFSLQHVRQANSKASSSNHQWPVVVEQAQHAVAANCFP